MIVHVPCFAWGVQGGSAGPTTRKQLVKERFPDGRSQRCRSLLLHRCLSRWPCAWSLTAWTLDPKHRFLTGLSELLFHR